MSEPETFYRGHKIRWSDNADEWTCYDLSDKVRASPKLSLIKSAIDRLYLAERKSNAVPCFEISYQGTRSEGNVIEYLGSKTPTSWNGTVGKTEHKVAVVSTRKGNERPSRRELRLDDLVPIGAEAEAAWSEFLRLNDIAKKADTEAKAALAAVPRMTPENIAALVELHNREEQAP